MSNELSIMQKDITDSVNLRVKQLETDGLRLPANYNASNALKTAFFAIKKVETKDGYNKVNWLEKFGQDHRAKESIANALLDMVTQGLSPAKTQVYFTPYANELKMQRSYFGTQAVVKRLTNVKDIFAEVVHQDDVFKIGSDGFRTTVTEFEPSFENLDKPIIGAYAVVKTIDDELVFTVMTKKEIDQSWSKAKMHNVQKEFPQEMAKRTVINRAAKNFINTSDDSDLLVDSINRTTADEYDNSETERKDVTPQPKAVTEIFNKPVSEAPKEVTGTAKTGESIMPTAAEAAKALANDSTTNQEPESTVSVDTPNSASNLASDIVQAIVDGREEEVLVNGQPMKSVTEELGLSGSEGANIDVETSSQTKTSLADRASAQADFFQAESVNGK